MSHAISLAKLNTTNDASVSGVADGPSIAIVIYSLFGHIKRMTEAEKAGIEAAGGTAMIYQVAETLPASMLARVPKSDYPVIQPQDLLKYDGILVGVAARFASIPSQMKAFWDSTGQLWISKALAGKFVGAFVSTGGQGGGQEATFFSLMSTFSHHGMLFVPLGYKDTVHLLGNLDEVHGGSPWGAGTFAGQAGGKRRWPTQLELEIAHLQGKLFSQYVSRTDRAKVITATV